MISKTELRKKYLKIRDSLSPEARVQCSEKICLNVADTTEFKECEILLCYAPIRSEVDVLMLFDKAVSMGKTVAFPLVSGDDMEFYRVLSIDELSVGTFGVMEPAAADDRRVVPVNGKSLMIVPGAAFDLSGNRIGYGKGYYDRYLHIHGENVITMAVCFEKQVAGEINHSADDVPVDLLVTINGVTDCRSKRRYETVIKRIENSRRFADSPGVETSAKILESLGNPERKLEFVHVAGTNGKGSVCSLTASALFEAGLKVGLFTSPHLIRFNERIRIFDPKNIINDMDSTCISDTDVVRLAEDIRGTADAGGITLTMFDYCFAIAVRYFTEKKVDVVVLECGLGGRLDSTNAIQAPAVSVITSIGLDHMQYLGETLRDIANEKAGILKTGTNAVIGTCDAEVKEIFAGVCENRDIPVDFLTDDDLYEGRLGLKGEYQRRNAAVAERTVRCLFENKNDIFTENTDIDKAIERGFAKAMWDGRFQVFRESPLLIIDGAHNEHGVRALKESIMKAYPGRKFDLVMGVMRDKDFTGMLKDMLPLCKTFYASQTDYGRALPASELADIASQCGYEAVKTLVVNEVKSLKEDTVIFGSLYFVGDVLSLLGSHLIQ